MKNALTGVVYPANTPIPAGAINPLSAQIISYFKQISGLPVSGLPSTGLASNNYAVQVPFTDNADKGDLRLDWQINPSNSVFLRISDRKENGVNYPSIPIPLDGQTNGNIRILDQQIALGYTRLLGANKSSMLVLAWTVPKPASSISRSATLLSTTFPVCRPTTPSSPGACRPSVLRASPVSAVRAPTRSGRIPPSSTQR